MLQILHTSDFRYRFATAANAQEVKDGSVNYWVPEILQTGDYSSTQYGQGAVPQIPQAGLRRIDINVQRFAKYEYETYDVERMSNSDYIIGQIASSLAIAIQADLNAQFWMRVYNLFATGGELNSTTTPNPNIMNLKFLGSGFASLDNLYNSTQADAATQLAKYAENAPNSMWVDYRRIQNVFTQFYQTYTKQMIGVAKNDITAIMCPQVDDDMMTLFRNQPNVVGGYQLNSTAQGTRLGNLKYVVDPMLNNEITVGASFNGDYTLNLSGILGIIFHRQAIAFPMNLQTIGFVQDPNNLNPRWIAKYQFGFGVLRPNLIKLLKLPTTTIGAPLATSKVNNPALNADGSIKA